MGGGLKCALGGLRVGGVIGVGVEVFTHVLRSRVGVRELGLRTETEAKIFSLF